jgi:hypothetical protein
VPNVLRCVLSADTHQAPIDPASALSLPHLQAEVLALNAAVFSGLANRSGSAL